MKSRLQLGSRPLDYSAISGYTDTTVINVTSNEITVNVDGVHFTGADNITGATIGPKLTNITDSSVATAEDASLSVADIVGLYADLSFQSSNLVANGESAVVSGHQVTFKKYIFKN
jgi:hypothetical protein